MNARSGHDQAGRWAEALAAWYLRIKGYRILAARFSSPAGEIDLIGLKGCLVIFVEVKLRRDLQAAAFSIAPLQQRRITRAAEAFLKVNPGYAAHDLRFDAVLFGRWTWPLHIEDAWRPEHF